MAITKLNEIKGILNELKTIRATLEPLKKREKMLSDRVKEYLIEHEIDSLTTVQCTAVMRYTDKYFVADGFNEYSLILDAIRDGNYDCLSLNCRAYKEVRPEAIKVRTDKAVRITYPKK